MSWHPQNPSRLGLCLCCSIELPHARTRLCCTACVLVYRVSPCVPVCTTARACSFVLRPPFALPAVLSRPRSRAAVHRQRGVSYSAEADLAKGKPELESKLSGREEAERECQKARQRKEGGRRKGGDLGCENRGAHAIAKLLFAAPPSRRSLIMGNTCTLTSTVLLWAEARRETEGSEEILRAF